MRHCLVLRHPRRRRGSALLVCTLAVAVVAMSAVAILRSNQRSIASVDGIRASLQARCEAAGMLQRSIAALRLNPTLSGMLPLGSGALPGARCELTVLSPNAVRVNCFLYDRATVPARSVVIDPLALSGVSLPSP